jgi:hypothetical protein
MIGRLTPSLSLHSRALALGAALLLVTSTAHARKPSAPPPPPPSSAPTTPANLQVTGTTAYSVSFAWGASTDDSGVFSYQIVNTTRGSSVVVPQTQTTFTWFDSKLGPNQTNSFNIYAVDGANNWSKPSNMVTATLPADTTTPSTPVMTLTEAGPTHLSIAWTIQDDDPTLNFVLTMNGLVLSSQGSTPSYLVAPLTPATAYTFTVKAKDSGGHWSAESAPLTASTTASDPDDHTPPTAPPGFWGDVIDGACEVMLSWGDSTDDVTPSEFIVYRISDNGRPIDSTSLGYTQVFEYGIVDGLNTFEVVAVDEAGNVSAPVSVTLDLHFCVILP